MMDSREDLLRALDDLTKACNSLIAAYNIDLLNILALSDAVRRVRDIAARNGVRGDEHRQNEQVRKFAADYSRQAQIQAQSAHPQHPGVVAQPSPYGQSVHGYARCNGENTAWNNLELYL